MRMIEWIGAATYCVGAWSPLLAGGALVIWWLA